MPCMSEEHPQDRSVNPSDPLQAPTLSKAPAPADPYAPYPDDREARRARWRTVFPVISIALGVIGSCVQLGMAGQIVFWDWAVQQAEMDLPSPPDAARTVAMVQAVALVVLGAMLVAGSAMLLLRKPLGRTLVLAWSVCRLLVVVGGLAVGLATMEAQVSWGVELDAARREVWIAQGAKASDLPPVPTREEIEASSIRLLAVITVATSTWPFVMAIVLTRRHVREEVEGWRTARG